MTFPVVGSNIPLAYEISNSLRFNDNDSAYLTRTPSSAGNRKTWTLSCWFKKSNLGINHTIFSAGGSPSYTHIRFSNNGKFLVYMEGKSIFETTPVFRDVSAWYHVVVACDTTQATASNRVKLYINGNQITTFDNESQPTQNLDTNYNSTVAHSIGRRETDGNLYLDGYLAEYNWIDGQQLSPTDFGEFDTDSGVWKPKQYEGTYGTNGFYLKFNNTGNLGEDSSGNDNTFTPVNLSGTADVMIDTPTNNFCTLNAVDKDGHTNAEGNLQVSGDVVYGMQKATQGVTTGKWYFEARLNTYQNDTAVGLANETENTYTNFTGGSTNSVGYLADGRFFYNGSSTTYSSASGGNIFQVAFDADSGKIWVGINNTWQNSGDPAAGTGQLQTVSWNYFIPVARTVTTGVLLYNFGQDSSFAGNSTKQNNTDDNGYGNFYYAPPTGFLALCTQNLATALSPTIDDGSQYFNTVLYTGNGSTQSITGVGFQPDMVWVKNRTSARNNVLVDSSRGVQLQLIPDYTSAENNNADGLTAFGSDGFSVGSALAWNESSNNMVGWNWKANGGTTSSNTDGSITSTVQANTTAGFSIVTYTGDGNASATVGHGLGVAPDIVIAKCRSLSQSWLVWGNNLGFTRMALNQVDADYGNYGVSFSSSTITLPSPSDNAWSGSGQTYLMYCFKSIEGYSKFGSYTGNGSSDGTFVYTGFRPQWVMIKRTDSADNWIIFDKKRDSYNGVSKMISANLSNAEYDDPTDNLDFVSNGFKLRINNARDNASGGTYIYMAFAENPFVTSGAVPVTAR